MQKISKASYASFSLGCDSLPAPAVDWQLSPLLNRFDLCHNGKDSPQSNIRDTATCSPPFALCNIPMQSQRKIDIPRRQRKKPCGKTAQLSWFKEIRRYPPNREVLLRIPTLRWAEEQFVSQIPQRNIQQKW